MIDPSKDKLLSLKEISKNLPRCPSPACLWRWHKKGIRGIRLETILVGGRRYTTANAWSDFIEKTTLASDKKDVFEPETERSVETKERLVDSGLLPINEEGN